MGDVVFKVSPPGTDARTASDDQLLLNDKYPFHKLDVTKTSSFKNINISFTRQAPYPAAPATPFTSGFLTTPHIYQFVHGYDYIPAILMFDLNNYVAPDGSVFPAYQNGNTVLLGQPEGGSPNFGLSGVFLTATADTKNVYLNIITFVNTGNMGVGPTPLMNMIGLTAKIRLWVFAEDLANDIGP